MCMNDTKQEEYKEFMDLAEVARYLGVHINTIYKYIRDKKNPLPTFQISDRIIRVKKEELDKWIENYRKNGGK